MNITKSKLLRNVIAGISMCSFSVSSLYAAELVEIKKSNSSDILNITTSSQYNIAQDSNARSSEFIRRSSSLDGRHTRYDQYYNGVRIKDAEIITHKDQHVSLFSPALATSATGFKADNLGSIDTSPSITTKQAIQIGKKFVEDGRDFKQESAELLISIEDGTPRLVYEVSYFAHTHEGPRKPVLIIDANNGETLSSYENLQHAQIGTGPGGNQKTGLYEFGSTKPKFDVSQSGSTCTLENENVKTVNLNHSRTGNTAHSFDCPRNNVKSINGAYSPLNDAHYGGNVVFNMYQDWYGISPLTQQLVLNVHYSQNYENAFWDGQSMTFGDGANRFYPLTVLDIISHEVSHGFTQQNSNLTYSGQSGGINESFSDIAGEAAECYESLSTMGICHNDWLVGAQATKELEALRFFKNPTADGRSIGHANYYRQGMDVHFSSGVFNRAFYLLAHKPGWDVKHAFDIFVYANQNYWTASSGFNNAACGVAYSAQDLGHNIDHVAEAFASVGVETCIGDPGSCSFECEAEEWDRNAVYNNGDTVSYHCKEYSAQWWNTGNEPTSSNVWTYSKDCDVPVNELPIVTLTSPQGGGEVFLPGEIINIEAEASDTDGYITRVDFYQNDIFISSDTNAPYTATFSSEYEGPRLFNAIAYDDNGDFNTSNVKKIVYDDGINNKPILLYLLPENGQQFNVGDPVINILYAQDLNSELNEKYPLSLVEFFVNGEKVYEIVEPPINSCCSYTLTNLPEGEFRLSASATDMEGAVGYTEEDTVINVGNGNNRPTVTITSPSNNEEFSINEQVEINADASDDGAVIKVEFYADGSLISTDFAPPYTAFISRSIESNVTLSAKATDDTGLSADSANVTILFTENDSCGGLPVWDADTVYALAGTEVAHNGNKYENRWWTKGEDPELKSGPWQVWINNGSCN